MLGREPPLVVEWLGAQSRSLPGACSSWASHFHHGFSKRAGAQPKLHKQRYVRCHAVPSGRGRGSRGDRRKKVLKHRAGFSFPTLKSVV